jgi:hypothetical protein
MLWNREEAHNKEREDMGMRVDDRDSMMTWKRQDAGGSTREYLLLLEGVIRVITDLS